MPTIRSKYTLEQFNEKLQMRAYTDACRIVTGLSETARIGIQPGKVERIDGAGAEYRFNAKHTSYTDKGRRVEKPSDYWRECPSCEKQWLGKNKLTCGECGAETVPSIEHEYPDRIDIDIEHKIYNNSPHATKISYYAPEDAGEAEAIKKRVEGFLAELMKGVEPEPRFSLKNFSEKL